MINQSLIEKLKEGGIKINPSHMDDTRNYQAGINEGVRRSIEAVRQHEADMGEPVSGERGTENGTGAQETGAEYVEQPDDCRKAFEKWVSKNMFSRIKSPKEYRGYYWTIWESAWDAHKPKLKADRLAQALYEEGLVNGIPKREAITIAESMLSKIESGKSDE